MLKAIRTLPWFRVLAIAQTALLAREHLRALSPADRRRLAELGRHPHRLTPLEREEMRQLVAKLEPRAFAAATASRFAPVPLPRRVLAGRRVKR